MAAVLAIEVKNLDFRFETSLPLVLKDVSVELAQGSRTLLIGANGAGKSSLLRILGGRHFHAPQKVRVLGRPAFHDTSLAGEVAHLGERWGYESHGDVSVSELIRSIEGSDAARCAELMEVLEVEPDWRIYRLSDGQRRRVQLLLGLSRFNKVLLLDEVTTDLDLVARQNLLKFLRDESELRGVTIVYATHIFDGRAHLCYPAINCNPLRAGLEQWATDLVYIRNGRVQVRDQLSRLPELQALRQAGEPAPLFRLVEAWLRSEFEERRRERAAEVQRRKAAGQGESDWVEQERTLYTGLSRGALIPAPVLPGTDGSAPQIEPKELTPAQRERIQWQNEHNATATVCTVDGGAFTADLPKFSGTRFGFNKTNPMDRS
mmetsp:Transcript_2947/g.8178  ORF Transcript_2947/g.8178 Transcript_2947/m.8178 type:complete len:376 (+) Transcript_2947:1596-2723(+)